MWRKEMSKLDLKKQLKHLYNPSKKEFSIVEVPPMNFLMINGHGDPNVAQEYQDAVEALYGVAYKLKFMSKQTRGMDYVVPPLEGLWWADDLEAFTTERDKRVWDWTMMIMQPEWITQEMLEEAVKQVEKKKSLPALSKLRLETYHEGLAVQIMHLGSYDDEGPTIARMHAFIAENGYALRGKHHEIYLSDPRKTAPEKLKTVIRQPIQPYASP
jgi:hypothetical protein